MAAKLTNRITAAETATAAATVPSSSSASSSASEAEADSSHTLPNSRAASEHQSRHSKTRLRKRAQLTLPETYRTEMHSREIEWANPCSGVWQEKIAQKLKERERQRQNRNQNRGKRCLQYKKLLRKLQKSTRTEFREFRKKAAHPPTPTPPTAKPTAIDTRQVEMETWALHNASYNFLPSLRSQSNIALRRWHRGMQTFVAAFSYMRRAQLHWDYHHSMQESPASLELKQLKKSARKMLCNVESTINKTSLIYGRGRKRQQTEGTEIISRHLMEERLRQFKTPIMQLYSESAPVEGLDDETSITLDIKFLKHYYVEYLDNMTKLLRTHVPKLCLSAKAANADVGSLATTKKLTIAPKPKQKKLPKAQKPQ